MTPTFIGESAILARLRRENYLRSWSIASICVAVSVLYLGTTLNPLLRDTFLDAIPNSHLAAATIAYALVYLGVSRAQDMLARYRFSRTAPRRIRNPLVARVSRDISSQLGLRPL